ncbi:MAG: ferredoxin [Lentisphaerae bacterium]|nr:ferredoxin [Lentisphaerota bacterium]
MIVTIRASVCVGCGVCAKFCPNVFRMDGAVAKVVLAAVPPDEQDLVHATADVCPVAAIEVKEDRGHGQAS